MQSSNPKFKASYERPELTVFGSIRNLTGGSTGRLGDGSSGGGGSKRAA